MAIERYRDKAGEHRWRFRSEGNDRILADSGEGYQNEEDMEHALKLLWPPDDAEAVAAALAILTLVTGDDWDRQKLLDHSATLRETAVHTLKKQGLTDEDAATFVDSRWKDYAADIPASQDKVEAPATTQDASVSSVASELGPITTQIPTEVDMAARLAEYRARKAESPDPLQDPGSGAEAATSS